MMASDNKNSKNGCDDDFLDYLIISEYAKNHSQSSSSSSSAGGGCFGVIVLAGVFIVLLSLAGSCLGCSGSSSRSRYTGTRSSYSSRTTGSATSSTRKNSVEQIPGLSHSLFKEGEYVTDRQLEMMEWQGDDSRGFDEKATKYRYDIDNYIYVIWVNRYNRILKVSTTIRGYASGSE